MGVGICLLRVSVYAPGGHWDWKDATFYGRCLLHIRITNINFFTSCYFSGDLSIHLPHLQYSAINTDPASSQKLENFKERPVIILLLQVNN